LVGQEVLRAVPYCRDLVVAAGPLLGVGPLYGQINYTGTTVR
jgi:hypothetical protein